MGKFMEGTLGEILDGHAFKNGDLNQPNSFAVLVYHTDDRGVYYTPAVLTFTGNGTSVYDGKSAFTLTTADGETIDYSSMNDNNLLVNADNNLDAFIRVYDVGEENFGNTTVENLEEQVARANGEGSSQGDSGGSQSDSHVPADASSYPDASDINQFGIEAILGGSYPHVAEILYVDYIKTSASDVFDTYSTAIDGSCDNVNELVLSIEGTLSSSNSSAFYSGETASGQVTKLKLAGENASKLVTAVDSVKSSDVSGIITSYNDALKEAKELVRRELLEKDAKAYNDSNVVYETNTTSEMCGTKYGDETKEEIDSSGHFRIVTKTHYKNVDDGINRGFAKEVTVTKYRYIKAEGTFSDIESRFNFHDVPLPYSLGNVIE